MTKAVCSRHQVAYEASAGCADCLAMERDAYLARGLPNDDATTYLVTPEMVTAAVVDAFDRGGWREATGEQILADLAVLAERFNDRHLSVAMDGLALPTVGVADVFDVLDRMSPPVKAMLWKPRTW